MATRMLIDASQPEENRVAVVEGKKIFSFDFESTARKQLKSNIYLAKVTRVEPSLQAAFIDYGGNRHGFLAFSEIHPDYYRIPVEDREALLAEEADIAKQEAEEAERAEAASDVADSDKKVSEEIDDEDTDDIDTDNSNKKKKPTAEIIEIEKDKTTETVGGESALEEEDDDDEQKTLARRLSKLRRRYKIQEVIKPRQIVLIQVTKEERGNKGAALTTYISLPGRYCVLMPNSPRGGGVSRKISNPKDRKRLREILKELNIPAGMSVILRTAGVNRNKSEIKRDLDYLLRLWNNIRAQTLESTAPSLIYEEGDLCKRAVRDLYTPDVSEILVAGDKGYRRVKDFMKMLIPSHAKKVVHYKDEHIPLFHRYQVENEINDIFNPRADLPSGGYIIINPTEALVSIDVNSGRATRERNVDDMALKTNMEAAVEIARQLRLRDLGGLVVIDFIDMEHYRHNTKVERKLKEAMSNDRARIEIGRISGFGLLELSRQRLRPSLTETHFETCPHCQGVGIIRTVDSSALLVLRAIEEEGIRGRSSEITVTIPNDIALYILNHKRDVLAQIETNYACRVYIRADQEMRPHELNLEHVRGSKQNNKRHKKKDTHNLASRKKSSNSEDKKSDKKAENDSDQKTDQKGEDERRNGRNNRRRRSPYRTRRGGRGRRDSDQNKDESVADQTNFPANESAHKPEQEKTDVTKKSESKPKKAKPSKKPAKKKADQDTKTPQQIEIVEGKPEDKGEEKVSKTKTVAKKSTTAKKKSEKLKVDQKEPEKSEHIKVNDAPEKPKKGWWNKLIE